MKNRILGLAVAAAALAGGATVVGGGGPAVKVGTNLQPAQQGTLEKQAEVRAIQERTASGYGYGWGSSPIRKKDGYSVAHGKRMALKKRNRLRARGHHRKAVR